MKIAIGSDHGGFDLKTQIASHLRSQGHQVTDVGTSSREATDYPKYANAVARLVASKDAERGIVIDGAGIGSAMVANKVPGVRAALAYDLSSAMNSREHNDANVLTLGAGLIGPALARQIVDAWLAAQCTEDRHRKRVAMIADVERDACAIPPRASSSFGPSARPDIAGPPPSPAPPAAPPAHSSPAIGAADLERIALELEKILGRSLVSGPLQPCSQPAAVTGALAGVTLTRPLWPTLSENPAAARRFIELGVGRFTLTSPEPGPIPDDIASYIDHTLLKSDATGAQIKKLCAEAREHRFAAVCVNPIWAALATRELSGSGVVTCCVVGFPLGATYPEIKALEARRAIREGAREIDMVINIAALKDGDDAQVFADICAVVEACRDGSARCKVILETAVLTEEEKRRACRLARRARAHFVKTSTGFGPGGATAEDVALMASEVRGAGMEVKAAGGIRSYSDAERMITAGATRIGASAGVAIVEEARKLTLASETR
ncbi:MAG: deoxyribose-phosphate aldolase [Candidatus Eisenbacteria bacterium]|nr:deoxyribose-phosphate aldolase [Candidatus Eisenbacteria bacterium]